MEVRSAHAGPAIQPAGDETNPSYSAGADILGVWLPTGSPSAGSEQIAPNRFVEFDSDGRVLGLEILDASHQ